MPASWGRSAPHDPPRAAALRAHLDLRSLRTSVGFALIGAVVGEYLGSHEGMGYVISYAESMFNATGVLAGLLVLMAAVIAIDLGLKRLDRRFSYWKPVR